MPVPSGLVVAVVVVLVVVSAGAGYYAGISTGGTKVETVATTTTTVFTSGFSSAQSTSSTGIGSTSTVSTSCNQTHPLSLAGIEWINERIGQEPGYLSMQWRNCAGQSIEFNPLDSPGVQVTVAMTAYGQTNKYGGYIYSLSGYAGPFGVLAGGSVKVSMPVFVTQAYSPNAAVVWVAGSVTAYDPGTGQAISMPSPFNVTA